MLFPFLSSHTRTHTCTAHAHAHPGTYSRTHRHQRCGDQTTHPARCTGNAALTLPRALMSAPPRSRASMLGTSPWRAAMKSAVCPSCNRTATRHDPRALRTPHSEAQTGFPQHARRTEGQCGVRTCRHTQSSNRSFKLRACERVCVRASVRVRVNAACTCM